MALPFKRDSEPANRQAEADPFLEFEPERPSVFTAPFLPQVPSPAPAETRAPEASPPGAKPAVSLQIRHRSGVGAIFVLAILVALSLVGLAVVAGWGDQIGQAISSAAQSLRTAVARTPASGGGSLRAPAAPPASPEGTQGGAQSEAPAAADAARVPPVVPVGTSAPGAANTAPRPSPTVAEAAPSTLAGPASVTLSSGVVAFRSPLDLEVFHQGQLVGTTGAGGLTMPAGVVDVVLVNARYEFRQARSVTVPRGQTISVAIALPNGRLSLNADPWAQVLIDNRLVGTTPLANLPVRIGSHEVVWRHPILGERRQVVIVKARTPTRVGVNFRR